MNGAKMKPFRHLLLKYRKHKVHNYRFKAKGQRNWNNLLEWLKGYHTDPDLYPCLKHARNASQPTTKIAVAAFEIVESLQFEKWEKVLRVLTSFNKAISAENGSWGA